MKTVTCKAVIPPNRQLHLTIPAEIPPGPAEIVLVIAPDTPAVQGLTAGDLLRSPLYDRNQKLWQILIIWFVPIIGAGLVFAFLNGHRPRLERTRGPTGMVGTCLWQYPPVCLVERFW